MSGEKTRKLDTLAKLFQTMRSTVELYVDLTRLSDNLLKLNTTQALKNLSRWITKTRDSKYGFALSAH